MYTDGDSTPSFDSLNIFYVPLLALTTIEENVMVKHLLSAKFNIRENCIDGHDGLVFG